MVPLSNDICKIMLEEEKEKLGCYVYLYIEQYEDDIYFYHYIKKKSAFGSSVTTYLQYNPTFFRNQFLSCYTLYTFLSPNVFLAIHLLLKSNVSVLCSWYTLIFFFVILFLFSPGFLYVLYVSHKLNFIMLSSCLFYNSYSLLTLPFLRKQTRHGRNIISFYFFLFISGHAKCLLLEQCVGWWT